MVSAGSFQSVSAGLDKSGAAVAYGVLTDDSLWKYDPKSSGPAWQNLSPSGTILSAAAAGPDQVFAVTANGNLWQDTVASGWSLTSTGSFASISGARTTSGGQVFAVLADTSWWTYGTSWSELSGTGALAGAAVTPAANLTAAITGLPSSGYIPKGTQLTLGSSVSGGVGADTYSWTVTLNGVTVATGTAASLSFTPSSTGTYQVALIVTDSAKDTASAGGSVVADLPPTVSLGGPYSGQAGAAITLTAGADNPNSGEAAGFTYSWAFGDGKTDGGTASTDSHAYAAVGTYTATVTATDSVGETATATATVNVSADLTAKITGLPASGYSPKGTQLTLGSSVSGGVGSDTYNWTVTTGGVTVATGTAASLSFTPSSTGTYQVALTVTDSAKDTASAGGSVVADLPPTVSLGGPYSGQAGSAITLTASAGNPNSGEKAGFTYSWAFGDGKTDGGASATDSHAYAAMGTYTATVTATDSVGETATATATVNVAADLTAAITGLPASGKSPVGMQLSLGSSVSGGVGADAYSWTVTLGGATVATGSQSTLSFTPAETGTYQVTLVVTDADKDTATASGSVQVTSTLTVSLGGPYAGDPSAAVTLLAAVSGQNLTGLTYSWTFGDGGTQSGSSPLVSYSYAAAGAYTASVTVTNSDGATGTSSAQVTVASTALQPVTLDGASYALAGSSVAFSVSNPNQPPAGGFTYHWSFGDGATDVTGAPVDSHAYTAAGSYTAAVTVTDNKGDQAVSSTAVTISSDSTDPLFTPVVNSSSFSYVGSFRMPTSAGGQDTFIGGPLTYRYVNGNLQFLSATTQGLVYETNYPGVGVSSDPSGLPQAQVVNYWGDVYTGQRWVGNNGGDNAMDGSIGTDGLYYDQSSGRLYWSYDYNYNATNPYNPSLGYSTLNAATGTATGVGAWSLTGRQAKFDQGG